MSDKQLCFKVVSTEGHKEYFATHTEAKKYVELLKEGNAFIECRISEVEK